MFKNKDIVSTFHVNSGLEGETNENFHRLEPFKGLSVNLLVFHLCKSYFWVAFHYFKIFFPIEGK
jgi:hypothetical protein